MRNLTLLALTFSSIVRSPPGAYPDVASVTPSTEAERETKRASDDGRYKPKEKSEALISRPTGEFSTANCRSRRFQVSLPFPRLFLSPEETTANSIIAIEPRDILFARSLSLSTCSKPDIRAVLVSVHFVAPAPR